MTPKKGRGAGVGVHERKEDMTMTEMKDTGKKGIVERDIRVEHVGTVMMSKIEAEAIGESWQMITIGDDDFDLSNTMDGWRSEELR
jgi:hypothetical protein